MGSHGFVGDAPVLHDGPGVDHAQNPVLADVSAARGLHRSRGCPVQPRVPPDQARSMSSPSRASATITQLNGQALTRRTPTGYP